MRDELPYRLQQQALLGEFGRFAMQSRDLEQILQRAAELCAQGLEAPYAKVLEYLPEGNRLEVRAGVGWGPGTIDQVTLGADLKFARRLRLSHRSIGHLQPPARRGALSDAQAAR